MGKISKALEKAEKQNLIRQIDPSRGRQDESPSALTETPTIARKAVLPENEPGSNAPVARQSVRRSNTVEPLTPTNGQPIIPATGAAGKQAEPTTVSKSSGQTNVAQTPSKPLAPKSVESSTMPPHPDAVAGNYSGPVAAPANAAKAEGWHSIPRQQAAEAVAKVSTEEEVHTQREKISVSYSKTKVQFNDPEKLKNNKVLSIFDDIETANQFKILRTQVLRKLKATGGNSILVTSANPYEGKTFTSINLGVSIAKEFDRTVLIIDADIRRPTRQHTDFSTKFFSLKVEKGLTDYLAGYADLEEILINPGIDKITLIPGGAPVDNSPELLNSTRMKEMMAEIKSRYPADRLVIVDGPALLHFPDAMILYRYVDGVLPVVEAEKTSSEDLKKMMKQLKDVNLLGVVLNKNKG